MISNNMWISEELKWEVGIWSISNVIQIWNNKHQNLLGNLIHFQVAMKLNDFNTFT